MIIFQNNNDIIDFDQMIPLNLNSTIVMGGSLILQRTIGYGHLRKLESRNYWL
jgi:hypothetical protein